ncbi:MAG: hypothetical protein L0H10_01180 [Comamonas sp.]|uniref:hypothetical protein n=1 Tax=Comamonas sp. TaxID=34028 RepID=UPI002648BF4B|nr:hypothetical protein [Comamonas sp.]MDN5502425.1 hypothetical protein [Comamonas sp.]MDN5535398.1 hypothetical protein [Comamonas sp.]
MTLFKCAVVSLLFTAAPAMAASWSGLYLGPGNNNNYTSLQLVETKEGSIFGRYRQISVSEFGTKIIFDAPVSGAAHGNQLVGRIDRHWLEGGTLAFSGTRTNTGIQLAGGEGLQSSLVASSESEEQTVVAELTARAKKASDAVRAKSGLSNINRALNRAREFQIRGADTLTALSKIPVHYNNVLAKQEKMAVYARSLPDSVARWQVVSAMDQLVSRDLKGTQLKVENSISSAKAARDQVVRGLAQAKELCNQLDPAGSLVPEYASHCQLVQVADEATVKLSQELSTLFNRLIEAYKVAEARSEILSAEVNALR